MKVARVHFLGKEGIGETGYSYSCDGYESGLLKGDWVIVSSARSKYSLGVFMGYEILEDEAEKAVVTQRVVATTNLREK